MNYKLELLAEADDDIDKFSNREKIINSPELDKSLGNKNGYNLFGCRKMYVDNKKIRIVYRVIDDKIIIEVVAVGKRNDMEVYNKASKRL